MRKVFLRLLPEKEFENIRIFFKPQKIIYQKKSKHQKILIFEDTFLGKILVLDDFLQLSEKDEKIYHQSLVLPLFKLLKNPQKILIVGGGDGGCLREVLKYKNLKEVFLVDFDKEVMEVSKKFLPFLKLKKSLKDKRVKVFFEKGEDFIKKFNSYFDAIIVDLTDTQIPPAKNFFKISSLKNLKRALSQNGGVSLQAGSVLEKKHLKNLLKKLKKIFPSVLEFKKVIPSFFAGEWCFVLCFKKEIKNLPEDFAFLK